jgi:hypothetical protein
MRLSRTGFPWTCILLQSVSPLESGGLWESMGCHHDATISTVFLLHLHSIVFLRTCNSRRANVFLLRLSPSVEATYTNTMASVTGLSQTLGHFVSLYEVYCFSGRLVGTTASTTKAQRRARHSLHIKYCPSSANSQISNMCSTKRIYAFFHATARLA